MKIKKIDIHVHVTPEKDLERFNGGTYPTPVELREMYNAIGVEKGVLLPYGTAPECSTDRISPREAHKLVKDYPDTLGWWFCSIDPRAGRNSPDTDFSHFLNYYKSKGARGVGELTANLYLDDPRVLNLFAHCEKCDMPVTIHFGRMGNDYGLVDDFGLPHLEMVLQKFPRLKVLGHSVRFWSLISGDATEKTWDSYPSGKVVPGGRVIELMRLYPNLCCDLSSVSGYNAMTRDPEFSYSFFEEFQDRIFYGTDIHDPRNITNPMLKLSAFLDEAAEKGYITWNAYEKICRGNAMKLLG